MSNFHFSPDFLDNELVNVVIESKTTSNIGLSNPVGGKLIYDSEEETLKVGNGTSYRTISASDTFKTIRVKDNVATTNIISESSTDVLELEAGLNVSFNANATTRKIIINATGNGTPNYNTIIGDGFATNFDISHDLNSENLIVSLWENQVEGNLIFTDIKTVDANIVRLSFFEPPTSNSIRLVLSERKGNPITGTGTAGDKGEKGNIGATGTAGDKGSKGDSLTIPGLQYETLRYSSVNVIASSNVLRTYDDRVEANAETTGYALTVKNNFSKTSGNIDGDGLYVSVKSNNSNVEAIDIITTELNNNTSTSNIFKVTGSGNIIIPKYANVSMNVGPIIYVKSNGQFEKSNIDMDTLYASSLEKKITVTLDPARIQTTYDTPVVLVQNSNPNTYILPTGVVFMLSNGLYATPPYLFAPYIWDGEAGIGFGLVGATNMIYKTSYSFRTTNSKTILFRSGDVEETPSTKYYRNGLPLLFYTDTENPSPGAGYPTLNTGHLTITVFYKMMENTTGE